MVKIHSSVYILVGLFVSILSWKLNYEKLIFFFYTGLVFVFVGIVKLIFNLAKKKMSKKQAVHKLNIKYCHQCGAALRLHHRFCTRCGART